MLHIVHLIERRFPGRGRLVLVSLLLVSALGLVAGLVLAGGGTG